MKYRDSQTGQFKDIKVKAFDSLPIGAQVDYNGEEVPDGWKEVDSVTFVNSLNDYKSSNISNVTRGSLRIKNGVAYLSVYCTLGVALSANTNTLAFNLPNNARPIDGEIIDFPIVIWNSSAGRGFVNADGTVYIRSFSATSSGAAMQFNFSYITQ